MNDTPLNIREQIKNLSVYKENSSMASSEWSIDIEEPGLDGEKSTGDKYVDEIVEIFITQLLALQKQAETYETWVGGGQGSGHSETVEAVPISAINQLLKEL